MVDPQGNDLWTKDITIAGKPALETVDGTSLGEVLTRS